MFNRLKQFSQQFKKSLNNIADSYGSMSLPLREYKSSLSPLDAFELSLYANKAIEKRADKVGEVEFQVVDANGDPIEDDPILNILYKPNRLMTGSQFWSLWSKYMDIYGEAFIVVDQENKLTGTEVKAMHLLRSDTVKLEFDEKTGEITSAKQKTNKGETILDIKNLIYTYRPDPKHPTRGASILKAGIRAIETEIQISEYHAKVLQNGGRVEGIFNFKAGLSKEQISELRDKYDEHYSDAKTSGKPLFLGGDVDYKRVSLLPEEMAYLETKKLNLQDVAILTGVPKSMLGSFDDVKYANAEQSNRIFLNETIKPILNNLVNILDERLLPDDRTLLYVDPTPEDVETTLKKIENGIKNYYLTPNEARAMQGLDPIKGGDELLVPMNLLPMNDTTPVQPTKAKSTEFVHPLSDYDARRKYEKLAVKRLDRQEKKFKRALMSYFKGQEDRIISGVSLEKKFKVKDLIGEVFNQTLEVKLAKESVLAVLEELALESGENAKIIAGSDFDFRMSSDVTSFLDKKASVFAEQINETTFKKLKSEFSESFANGETRIQLVERIRETYTSISEGRANTIATTETHGVTQYATLEAYKQANLPVKVWVTVGDGKVRSSHASIDGEERPIGTAFSNGLQYPSDPSGSAGEVINCRCVI